MKRTSRAKELYIGKQKFNENKHKFFAHALSYVFGKAKQMRGFVFRVQGRRSFVWGHDGSPVSRNLFERVTCFLILTEN